MVIDAVLFGYRFMDALLRRFFALAEADTTIILCSALKARGEGWTAFLSVA
jgi:hypothetical protein